MKIKDVNVNYVQYGNKKGKNVVLLHGWGQNIKMMDPIGKGLMKDYYITNIAKNQSAKVIIFMCIFELE